MPFRDPVTTLPADAITGQIVGTQLAADAIDGKTITGALIRTAASGKRVELDSTYFDELLFFSGNASEGSPASCQVTGTGDLSLSGALAGSGGVLNAGANITVHGSISDKTIRYTAPGGHRFDNTITLTKASGGLELGDTATNNTPYIDFHTVGVGNGTPLDYDARIIASGGLGGTNGTATLDLEAGAVNVNGQDLWGGSTIITGTPAAVSGISGPAGINSASVPAYPFPTIQTVRMGNFISSQTVSTDQFDFYLRQNSVPQERARCSGGGLSHAPVLMAFAVPAGTACTYQNVVSRVSGGTGTMASTADGSLNYLQVTVQRAGA